MNENLYKQRRLALSINNSRYRTENNRLDPIYQTEDVNAALEKLHFKVTAGSDLTSDSMKTEIVHFCKKIRDGDLILFYFCGHGCQIGSLIYLVPVDDDRLKTEFDVKDGCYPIDRFFMRLLKTNKSNTIIMILNCDLSYQIGDQRSRSSKYKKNYFGKVRFKCLLIDLMERRCSPSIQVTNSFLYLTNSNNCTQSFVESFLKHIQEENVSLLRMFQLISKDLKTSQVNKKEPKLLLIPKKNRHLCINKEVISKRKRIDTDLS